MDKQFPRLSDPHPLASPRRRRWPSILVAVAAAACVVAAELWAVREAPAFDGSASSTVASAINRTLARVAAASQLVGPVD